MENYAERRENSGVLVVDDDGLALHFVGRRGVAVHLFLRCVFLRKLAPLSQIFVFHAL